ncbi:hypothetical protein OH809_08985 [Streptomyces sp. NBC_00873]|uniref:hypothetical protein n=1 Tax=unclassified Streptomyces TaxID=2593676 RepID=UPI00386B671A|nr:hypothetical protein OH809_08985 [Streptomyces sp. NBC_00873]WTA47177.1 hypothetical protein OH821_34835 [Streptomyces sp. NBC_00842]
MMSQPPCLLSASIRAGEHGPQAGRSEEDSESARQEKGDDERVERSRLTEASVQSRTLKGTADETLVVNNAPRRTRSSCWITYAGPHTAAEQHDLPRLSCGEMTGSN